MKKRFAWIDKYLRNSEKIKKTDLYYRESYVLNFILIIMLIVCAYFALVNIFIFKTIVAVGNVISFILSLSTFIYFKKTNNYKPAAYIAVGVILISITAYFHVVQNQNYAFYWLAVLPSVAYFLLGSKPAGILVGLYCVYILLFFIFYQDSRTPAEFNLQSISNITGATLSMVLIIAFFEKSRKEAWDTLKDTNLQLENNQNDLRLILDSAGEAIFGLDLDGNCTFCNKSCLVILGYNDEAELLGLNMHERIHHSLKDGTPNPIENCRIFKSYIRGEGSHVDDEVFWRSDGTFFYTEYHSFPKIKNGEIIGAVVTFTDITERKQKEADIQYLSWYDHLTGLINRRRFEENRPLIDIPDNLPLSVIFADINGLKMTNDIFGHSAGDELIKKSSEILRKSARESDTVSRIGGDEFILMLPRTNEENAGKVLERIMLGFSDARVEAIRCSISLGLDVKTSPEQSLDEIIANAENAMYKDKTMNRKAISKDIIGSIIETLHSKSLSERQHSLNVSALCSDMGYELKLSETEISKLLRAAYHHDIGKIVLDDSILSKGTHTEEEREEMRQHPAVGYRILNLFDETLDLAEYVYGHHENWNGTGYPRGLKGQQIPLLSRIIAIAETYDRVVSISELPVEDSKEAAVEVIERGAGTKFDPELAQLFSRLVRR